MEQFISTVQWSFFLKVAAVLILGYVIILNLSLIKRLLTGRESSNLRLLRFGRGLRVGYELVAVVILIVLYLRINVVTHGVVLAVVVALAWSPIRNLLNGRFLRLTTHLKKGQEVFFEGQEAIVRSLGPLAAVLQTNVGTQIVDYTKLREHGLTLVSGNQLSNFLELTVNPDEEKERLNATLDQLLLNCPYLDWSYRPEIESPATEGAEMYVKVLLVDERYTNGFRSLLGEWGYNTSTFPAK
ncbi:hypothetical protein [Neolewinella antarctica]|uniref:Uncharacterized protein n=1 Tax=Neolewinella antarctica TaxID=442734 RepID=A0ABX0XCQ9_9BACT|nr:hypothetical protein [Neolewinella antarctica]NJC27068.1 hypothetical protein [Neolewinella antarctica]